MTYTFWGEVPSETPRTDEARNYKADVVARNARLIDLAETIERERNKMEREIEYLKSCLASEVARDYERECRDLRKKIHWYEGAVCADIPHAIGPDVTGKAIDYKKVANIIRERDVLLADLTKTKNDFDEAIKQRDALLGDKDEYCEVLRVLGMDEEGSAVDEILRLVKAERDLRDEVYELNLRIDRIMKDRETNE